MKTNLPPTSSLPGLDSLYADDTATVRLSARAAKDLRLACCKDRPLRNNHDSYWHKVRPGTRDTVPERETIPDVEEWIDVAVSVDGAEATLERQGEPSEADIGELALFELPRSTPNAVGFAALERAASMEEHLEQARSSQASLRLRSLPTVPTSCNEARREQPTPAAKARQRPLAWSRWLAFTAVTLLAVASLIGVFPR
jgi:hypothetical protein